MSAATALAIQVGGDHYKRHPIQPIEFCEVNELGACTSAIVKYVMRYDAKDGAKDLRKASHYCELMIELADQYDLPWSARGIEWRAEAGVAHIPLETFIEANQLSATVAAILELVCIVPNPLRVMKAKLLIEDLLLTLPA